MKKTIVGLLAAVAITGSMASLAEAKVNFKIYLAEPYYDQRAMMTEVGTVPTSIAPIFPAARRNVSFVIVAFGALQLGNVKAGLIRLWPNEMAIAFWYL